MSKARGLSDGRIRLEKLSKKQDHLERLNGYIDFEFFRKQLQKFFDRTSKLILPKADGRLMTMC